MMDKNEIQQLKNSQKVQKLVNYLLERINAMDTVSGLESLDAKEAGIEARVRQKSAETLAEIIRPFLEREDEEPTTEDIQEIKDRAGL